MSNLTTVNVSGRKFFVIEEIASCCIKTPASKLKPAAIAWLKRNLPQKDIIKTSILLPSKKRPLKKFCISSDAINILGVYQAHIESGGDFRARWSDLPDSPSFYHDAKIDISWRNLYSWSYTEHFYNTRLDKKRINDMRSVFSLYFERFGVDPVCSLKEAKEQLGIK
jgi:hypothetical protein